MGAVGYDVREGNEPEKREDKRPQYVRVDEGRVAIEDPLREEATSVEIGAKESVQHWLRLA